MATETNNDTQLIDRAIRDAVKKDTELAFESLKEELIKKLDRERDTIIAGVVLNVMKLVNYKTFNDNLVITVEKRP